MSGAQPRKSSRGVLPNGKLVAELRKAKSWDQDKLASEADIEKRTLQKVEACRQRVDADTLLGIAEALGVKDINDLIAADSAPNKHSNTTPTIDSAVPDFTGRTKELAEIATHLQSGSAVCIVAVKAAGGMGKTELARKSAEGLKSSFSDGVILLKLDGMTTPKTTVAAIQEVVRRLIPATTELPSELDLLRPTYLGALRVKKLLLILDNAADVEQVDPLLTDLPKTVGVIITSRRLISLPAVKKVDLELMSADEAVELLKGIVKETRPELTDADLRSIAVMCGHLPLALRIAGTSLRDRPHMSYERYAQALETEPLRRLDLGTFDLNVGKVLSLSVRQLSDGNAEQAKRYQMLSVFPSSFTEDAAAAVWDLDADETFEELDDLLERSLIEWDKSASRYYLHDLMRPVAGDAFPDDHVLAKGGADRIAVANRRFSDHYADLLRTAAEASLVEGLARYDIEATNIAEGRAWADAHSDEDKAVAQLYCAYALYGGKVYRFRLTPVERVSLYERCLDISRRVQWREAEAKSLVFLGESSATLGQVEHSLKLYRVAAQILDELGDVQSKAVTMGKIADILQARGELDEALRILRADVLPVFERLGDVQSKAVTMGKIAHILQARGELDEALRIRREEELPVFERLGDVREKAVTMGKIADILQARGEIDEALRVRREDELPVYERLGDMRSAAVTMVQIADILQARGELDEALRIRREEVLPVFERLGDVRSAAVTMGQIADIFQARGELDEALRICREEELPVYERIGDVRSKALSMGRIADILQARGELDEALRIRREEVLPVFERLGDLQSKAVTIGNIAEILVTRGELDQALRNLESIKEIFFGLGDVSSMAATLGQIADILQTRGEFDEALWIRREEQLPMYEQLGDVRSVAVTMAQIADILQDRGEIDEALRIFRGDVLPVFERLGDVPEKAVTMGKIADILQDRGEIDEALRILREDVLPVFERLGDVRGMAVTMMRIADILQDRGEIDEALRILRADVLPVFERLGDVRQQILTRWNIALVLLNRQRTSARKEGREHLLWALAEAEKRQYEFTDDIRQDVLELLGK